MNAEVCEKVDATAVEYRLDEKLADSLARLIEHVEGDLWKDFARFVDPSDDHVYRDVVVLRAWLDRHSEAVACPSDDNPVDNHFGFCPECLTTDGCLNIGRDHWFVCHVHRVRWFVGSNLFEAWRDQTEDDWRVNANLIGSYREVEETHETLSSLEATQSSGPAGLVHHEDAFPF